jgi:hypothetical protein
MKYSCSRSPLEITRLAFFTILLALVCVGSTAAQPGYVPSVEELQKQLQPRFDELAARIKNEPRNTALYVERSKLYLELYRRAGYHGGNGLPFAEKALTDLSTAIELHPTRDAYAERAAWYKTLALYVSRPRYSQTIAAADIDLTYSRFIATESDLLNALRLSTNDEQLTNSYAALSQLYSMRAKFISTPAVTSELRARGYSYSVWDDFDRAIEYAKKWLKHAPKKAGEWPLYNEDQVAGVYEAKGRAAYELGELEIALAAFKAGEQYLTGHDLWFCNYYADWGDTYVKKRLLPEAIETFTKGIEAQEWNCRYLLERRADAYLAEGELPKALLDYTALWEKTDECCRDKLSVKRVKIYLKLNEPRQALAIIEDALKLPGTSIDLCPQIFLLRAEAYNQLGDSQRALADEQKAGKLGTPTYCVEY